MQPSSRFGPVRLDHHSEEAVVVPLAKVAERNWHSALAVELHELAMPLAKTF